MNDDQTVSQRLMGQVSDLRQYQELKTINDMERDATYRLYESLKRKLGSADAARAELRKRGYNDKLVK